MTTAELIEKLERAEGPSAQLDLAIVEWCQDNRVKGLCGYPGVPNYDPELWLERNGPITASIDAALTLVPEGWSYTVAWLHRNGRATVAMFHAKLNEQRAESHTPALALCIAALKAKEADNA